MHGALDGIFTASHDLVPNSMMKQLLVTARKRWEQSDKQFRDMGAICAMEMCPALAAVMKCAPAVDLMSLCKYIVLARCVMSSKESNFKEHIPYGEPHVGDTWSLKKEYALFVGR